jgi:hypothetical protein
MGKWRDDARIAVRALDVNIGRKRDVDRHLHHETDRLTLGRTCNTDT